MSTPEIRAVLDRSALESYARGHVHVGELIQEIAAEENAYVGIPAIALLEAQLRSADNKTATTLLNFVAGLPTTMVLGLNGPDVPPTTQQVLLAGGDMARGHAIWAAMSHGAVCFTTEPQAFPAQVLPDQIITIPADDA